MEHQCKVVFYFICMSFSTYSMAQRAEGLPEELGFPSFGLGAGQYHNDPGINVHITSSYLRNRFAIQIAGNLRWLDSSIGESIPSSWTKYSSLSLGLVIASGSLDEQRVRCYGKIGPSVILSNKRFSAKDHVAGSCVLGLEFFIYNNPEFCISYYVETGALISKAHAEKLEGNPGFSNGLLTITGFRLYPFK